MLFPYIRHTDVCMHMYTVWLVTFKDHRGCITCIPSPLFSSLAEGRTKKREVKGRNGGKGEKKSKVMKRLEDMRGEDEKRADGG